jgi:hypothetical protein
MRTGKKFAVFAAALTLAAGMALAVAFWTAMPCAYAVVASGKASGRSIPGGNDEIRAAFLGSLGWQVDAEPLEHETVTIPYVFGDVYNNYNDIQKKQGFDLSGYRGRTVERYTYAVRNYPGVAEGVRANLLVYKGSIIGGDVCTAALGGFMQGLARP